MDAVEEMAARIEGILMTQDELFAAYMLAFGSSGGGRGRKPSDHKPLRRFYLYASRQLPDNADWDAFMERIYRYNHDGDKQLFGHVPGYWRRPGKRTYKIYWRRGERRKP